MTKRTFERIAAGLREAVAVSRGEDTGARFHVFAETEPKPAYKVTKRKPPKAQPTIQD